MAIRRPRVEAELDGSKDVRSAVSVARDFEALVEIFEKQLELTSANDEDSRAHLIKAKAAAARGAQLSQSLLKRMRMKSAPLP
jgi:hypothetical protein